MLLMAILQCKMAQTFHDGELFRINIDQIDFLASVILDEQDEIDKGERVQESALQQIGVLGDLRMVRAFEPILFNPADHQVDEFFFGDCIHA